MNIPKYSLENQKIIYFFLAVMLIGGIYSFFKLPKKEDSPFVIKQAVLVTQYPGATPQEVEKLVTEPIEREIQAMSDVFQIKSESYFGMSNVFATCTLSSGATLSPALGGYQDWSGLNKEFTVTSASGKRSKPWTVIFKTK